MKHIFEYVCDIDDELVSAKDYAEKAIFWKYKNNPNRFKTYSDMSSDELRHAKSLHDLALEDIRELENGGFKPTESMEETWRKSHREFIEKSAWVKQILGM